jgi:hypothetical protein
MSNIQIARPPEGNYIPAFTVEKLEGTIKQKVYAFDERGVRTEKITEVDAGYLVCFPQKKHSIAVRTKAELVRLGFDNTIKLVDEYGDVKGQVENPVALVKKGS